MNHAHAHRTLDIQGPDSKHTLNLDFCRPHGSQKLLLDCFARVESFCPAPPTPEFGSARPGPLGTPQEDRPGPPGPGPARPSQPRLGQAQSAPTQPGPASPGSARPSQPRLGQAQPGPARLPRGPTGPRSVSPGPSAHFTLASLAHTLIFISPRAPSALWHSLPLD